MTPEQRAQMRRLARFREWARIAREQAARRAARQSRVTQAPGETDEGSSNSNENHEERNQLLDPLIYPGLYAPSGFNIMSILIRVRQRPNPQIDLGFIDSSCALLLCDFSQPDTPIVYVSEAFSQLTRYPPAEVLGRNCRFLQAPSGHVERGARRDFTDEQAVRGLKEALARREEHQVTVVNYKKGGERFENILTVVPISWEGEGGGDGGGGGGGGGGELSYVVGFQVDRGQCFLGPAPPPPPQPPPAVVPEQS